MHPDTIKNIVENAADITDARAMLFAYLMGCVESGNDEFLIRQAAHIHAIFRERFGKDS